MSTLQRIYSPTSNKNLKAKNDQVELVFVSGDNSSEEFDEYFKEMPWLALPFDRRSIETKLSAKYRVKGIPTLVLVGPDGSLFTTMGRDCVDNDLSGAQFPWKSVTMDEGGAAGASGGTLICGLCCMILLILSYLICGIVFLVRDKDIAEECEGSKLWNYVGVSLLLPAWLSYQSTLKNSTARCALFGRLFLYIFLVIFGGIELFSDLCEESRDLQLWEFGVFCFALQCLILLVNCCCLTPRTLWNMESSKPESESDAASML